MEMSSGDKQFFTQALMQWHRGDNDRSLPWKNETDPYRIWLSEVILQQTRAQQGLPYYLKFIETYPAVSDLAGADDEAVFRLWQGLGYYNRCKNMLATARTIANDHKGRFPDDYDSLLALKGIGPYTAAAIASFAFGLPYAVLDGNVFRVLARYFGIALPIDGTEGRRTFQAVASEVLDKDQSAAYNQAIMDLGATVCTPAAPLCDVCPLQQRCFAYRRACAGDLPVKTKKPVVKKRYFHYFLLQTDTHIWIRKRDGKDIWQNLYEPYLIESDKPLEGKELSAADLFRSANTRSAAAEYEGCSSQRLTHQLIEARFFTVQLRSKAWMPDKEGKWVKKTDLGNFAFPRTLVSFFEKKLYF